MDTAAQQTPSTHTRERQHCCVRCVTQCTTGYKWCCITPTSVSLELVGGEKKPSAHPPRVNMCCFSHIQTLSSPGRHPMCNVFNAFLMSQHKTARLHETLQSTHNRFSRLPWLHSRNSMHASSCDMFPASLMNRQDVLAPTLRWLADTKKYRPYPKLGRGESGPRKCRFATQRARRTAHHSDSRQCFGD